MSGLCIPQDILNSFHQYTAFLQVWGYVPQWQPHGRSHPSRSPGCVKLPGLVRSRKVATGTAHSVLLRSDGRVVACGDNRAGKPSWERPFLGGVSGGGFMGEGIRILIVSVLSEVENDGNPSRLCERPTLESVQSLLPRPGNAMFRCSKMA